MPNLNLRYTTKNVTRYKPSPGDTFFYTLYRSFGDISPYNTGMLLKTDQDGLGGSAVTYYRTNLDLTEHIIDCVQYNGRYFYSLHRVVSGTNWTGVTIRRWSIDEVSSILNLEDSRTYNGLLAYSFALESYNIHPSSYNTGTKTYTLSSDDDFIMSRLRINDWVLIKKTYSSTGTPYQINDLDISNRTITFGSLPGGHGVNDLLIIDVSVWLFDSHNGRVYEKKAQGFGDVSTHESVLFYGVNAATFDIVAGENRINSTQRTGCLFFRSQHTVFITTPDAPTILLASPILPYNYFSNKCDPIVSEALMVSANYFNYSEPQILSLQNRYRDPLTLDESSLQGYNYIEFNLFPYVAFMNTVLDKWTLTSGEITNCRCSLLDQYDFGIFDRNVHWESDDPYGSFLGDGGGDPNDTTTSSNGIAYNRYQAGWLLPGDVTRDEDFNYNQVRYNINTSAYIT